MSRLIFSLGAFFGIMVLSGCQSFQKNDNEIDEVPGNGLLGAKLMALEHALENISEDDKKFGDSEYFTVCQKNFKNATLINYYTFLIQ